jgi:ADP-heptose:LPS heptosyltransferase
MLPSSFGNPTPPYKVAITLPPGPRRIIDDGERGRFHVAAAGKSRKRARRQSPVDLRRCREILVVNLDFIGDWVLKTPFLENLRRSAQRARITAVVLDRVFDLASACRFVDRVVSVSRADGRRIVAGASNYSALADFRETFLRGGFDLAIVPRWDADFNGALQIAQGSGARRVVGFSERAPSRKRSLNRGDDRFYTHAFVDNRHVHEADRDLFLIDAMHGVRGPGHVSVDFTAGDAADADRFLKTEFESRYDRFLAVAPFGSTPRKTLPPEIVAGVVRTLAERFDAGIVVVGSPGESDRADAFLRRFSANAVSAAGILGTREIAALISRAGAFIGMDSGPAHIAAAVGTPSAVLFCHPADGSAHHTGAPERFAPRGKPGQVLVIQPDSARTPCRDGCESAEAHCILALTEEVLLERLVPFVGAALRR